ncbi:MAG: T9SS type A sorting domain-containing protein [Ignavibacteriaceae bacterium]|nr:T9SS type A sorting domain-containing protein [Ignavibacteriaceae bacterium]
MILHRNCESNDLILPKLYTICQNYPNPFNPITKIKYSIPQSPLLGGDGRGGLVTLKVYDILGREIATLVNEEKPAGEYEVEFNAANLPSGIYFYQLKAGQFTDTKKMVLIR